MRLTILLSVAAIAMGACAKGMPRVEASSSAAASATTKPPSGASAAAATPPGANTATDPSPGATPGGRHRLLVRVTSCLPVGYGAECSCEVRSSHTTARHHARLQSCVGSGDRIGLNRRLAAAPVPGSSTLPLSLWMDVEPAPDAERYCGILLPDSGERLRVVDFER